jgi:cytochrome c oxidase cbb3-type subunit 2
VPDDRAQALVAYLLSLKQPALPGVSSGESIAALPGAGGKSVKGADGAASAPGAGSMTVAEGYDAAKGNALYTANCAACHQASGEGLPGAFPSLKGDAVVNGAGPKAHIHVVLYGLQGASVGGVAYSSPMPAFGKALSDTDVANIINYERSSWGNQGKPVTAAQVAAERTRGK